MTQLPINQASRGALRDAVERARVAGKVTVLTVYGKAAAAVVPLANLERAILKAVPTDGAVAPAKESD